MDEEILQEEIDHAKIQLQVRLICSFKRFLLRSFCFFRQQILIQ